MLQTKFLPWLAAEVWREKFEEGEINEPRSTVLSAPKKRPGGSGRLGSSGTPAAAPFLAPPNSDNANQHSGFRRTGEGLPVCDGLDQIIAAKLRPYKIL
jgi:hypothetical protein